MSLIPYYMRQFLFGDPLQMGTIFPYWLNQPLLNEVNVGNAIGRVVDDDEQFSVEVDVSQFNPTELSVNIRENELVIEGHHRERTDANGKIERHFVRKYTIPKNAQLDTMESQLSDSGVLKVSAQKSGTAIEHSRNIPIQAAPRGTSKPNKSKDN